MNLKIRELRFETRSLRLIDPFSIAHGTSPERQTVIVTILASDGLEGYGEAAVVPYYRETEKSISTALTRARRFLEGETISPPDVRKNLVGLLGPDNVAAVGALDTALWDLEAKQKKCPLHQLLGVALKKQTSSITLSIYTDLRKYRRRLLAVRNWPLIKLKLGSGDVEHDLKLVELAKETVPGAICVDVNGGWTVDTASLAIPRITDERLQYIEQPIKPRFADWHRLRRQLQGISTPLIADESFEKESDLESLQGAVDGVNIKLRKVGGLTPAKQCMELARGAGMLVVVGCMIESSIGISAAAQLASLADFVDLDAPLLIANDPYKGVKVSQGELLFPNRSGHGAIKR